MPAAKKKPADWLAACYERTCRLAAQLPRKSLQISHSAARKKPSGQPSGWHEKACRPGRNSLQSLYGGKISFSPPLPPLLRGAED